MPSSVSAHTIKQVSLKVTLALKLRNTLLKAIVEETALKKSAILKQKEKGL